MQNFSGGITRWQASGIGALALLGVCLIAMPVRAEKADRTKPIEIDAASATTDLANNVQVLEGAVVLVQGTMRITAERMRVRRDAQEHILAELFGSNGNPVKFREKREGFNDFVEGQADRAEFDDRANTIKLFNRATLKNGGDQLAGEYIYYNSVTEVIQALGRIPDPKADPKAVGPATAESARVRIVIQPRSETAKTAPAASDKETPVSPPKKP